jgi:hypothetical protein
MGISQQIGASSLIKAGVIDNTANRPASPYEGQVIYQKDTDAVLVWNGTAWYPNWNMPWGIVDATAGGTSGRGWVSSTTNFNTPTSATDITGITVTFTPVSGRLYRAEFSTNLANQGTAQTFTAQITNGSNTVLNSRDVYVPASVNSNVSVYVILSGLSGSTTIKVRGYSSALANGYFYPASANPMQLVIIDIGPA